MRFNLDAANDLMRNYKLDAILFIDPASLKYFGYDLFFNNAKEWMLKPGGTNKNGVINFCLLPYKKNPVYIISAFSLSSIEKDVEENCDIIPYGPFIDKLQIDKYRAKNESGNKKNEVEKKLFESFKKGIFKDNLDALGHAISEYGLTHSRIAMEQDCISEDVVSSVKERFPAAGFFNGSEFIRLMRMIKTPEELMIIENCLEITEKAFLKAVNSIKNHTSLKTLKDVFKREIYASDAIYEHFFLFPRGMGMTESDEYIIEKNNILGFDSGVISGGYTSDTGITVFFGNYSTEDLDIYKNLFELIEEGANSVKPGARCSEVFKKMSQKMKSFDFSGNTYEGHGIGMGFREYPAINPNVGYEYDNGFENISADFIIEKGMVINFETSYGIFDQKSFQVEKTVVVTENGAKSFKFQERQQPVFI